MIDFDTWYQQAVAIKGSPEQVEADLPVAKSTEQLQDFSDDRYLSQMCLRVFRAGLKYAVVDAKWPAFEQVFFGFQPARCAMLSDDELDQAATNRDLIRHYKKLQSIRANAVFVQDLQQEYGSFGEFLAQWPSADLVGLWALMKRRGSQLGGNSGPYFLRMVGKDTFVATNDVVAALVARDILSKAPTSKRDLQTLQDAFNTWQQQSARPMCEISRIISYTVG